MTRNTKEIKACWWLVNTDDPKQSKPLCFDTKDLEYELEKARRQHPETNTWELKRELTIVLA